MKGRKKLIILTLILLFLLAVFFALRTFNAAEEEKKEQEEEASQIRLVEMSGLSKISYEYESEKFDFEKQDGTWVFADEPEVILEQDTVNELETEITGLTAVRSLEDTDALSDYGLEDALYTIKAENAEGNAYTIYIGNGVDSDYYLTINDKENIYTGGSSLVSAIQYDKRHFIQNDTLPSIGTDNIKKVTINGSEENDGVYKKSKKKNEDALSTILGGYGAISFGDCEDYNVTTKKELKQYGLNKKSRIAVTFKYKEDSEDADSTAAKEFTLYLGNADDSGTYRYIQVKGSDIVNKISSDTANNLLNVSN